PPLVAQAERRAPEHAVLMIAAAGATEHPTIDVSRLSASSDPDQYAVGRGGALSGGAMFLMARCSLTSYRGSFARAGKGYHDGQCYFGHRKRAGPRNRRPSAEVPDQCGAS